MAPDGRSCARSSRRADATSTTLISPPIEDGAVPACRAAEADKAGFTRGAQFTHIKYDFGAADSAIARLMYPALNHVLFNPVMPYEPLRVEGHARADARHSASSCKARASDQAVGGAPCRPRQGVCPAAGRIGERPWRKQQSDTLVVVRRCSSHRSRQHLDSRLRASPQAEEGQGEGGGASRSTWRRARRSRSSRARTPITCAT